MAAARHCNLRLPGVNQSLSALRLMFVPRFRSDNHSCLLAFIHSPTLGGGHFLQRVLRGSLTDLLNLQDTRQSVTMFVSELRYLAALSNADDSNTNDIENEVKFCTFLRCLGQLIKLHQWPNFRYTVDVRPLPGS